MSNVSIKRINYLGTSNKSLAMKSIISDVLTMLAFVFLKTNLCPINILVYL